jgi:single-strand DNA-binding protein
MFKDGEWKDGDTLFLRCSVWRQYAENVAESLTRGTRVIVQGRLKQRSYETREGEKRTVFEVDVEEIGPALRSATAKVSKVARSGGGFGGDAGSAGASAGASTGSTSTTNDPWAGSGDDWGKSSATSDEPPF